jgi:hypothetical protein
MNNAITMQLLESRAQQKNPFFFGSRQPYLHETRLAFVLVALLLTIFRKGHLFANFFKIDLAN